MSFRETNHSGRQTTAGLEKEEVEKQAEEWFREWKEKRGGN